MSPLLTATLAGFAAGALGAMGLGGGAVLLLCLALTGTDQLTAQGINLIFFLPVAALSLFLHRKNGLVSLPAALPMAAGGLLGLLCGVPLAGTLPARTLSRILGALTALIAVREIYSAYHLFRQNGPALLRKSPRSSDTLHKPPRSGKNSL